MRDEDDRDEGCCCIGSRMKKSSCGCGCETGSARKKGEERPKEE